VNDQNTRKVQIKIDLTPNQASALMRLADKFGHSDAKQFLYAHLPAELISDQAYNMVHALSKIEKALRDKQISAWPWIDCGDAKAETA
jgi:hypothetical protein